VAPVSELSQELARPPAWMYPWEVDGAVAPILGPELPSIHATRATMIEPHARAALAAGGRALDLGCSEGWFAHRLREWGADEVLGIDIRDTNVRRARLIADHYGTTGLRFEQMSVYEVDPADLGTFEVVLCFGLIYHLENPIGALRIARASSAGLCGVETQAARAPGGRHTWGTTGEYISTRAAWLTCVERASDQELTTLASTDGVISLVPNEAALVEAMRTVGFVGVRVLDAPAAGNAQYRDGDRLVAVGQVGR
jgi:tRNA (mo5U34)-methyltransferase